MKSPDGNIGAFSFRHPSTTLRVTGSRYARCLLPHLPPLLLFCFSRRLQLLLVPWLGKLNSIDDNLSQLGRKAPTLFAIDAAKAVVCTIRAGEDNSQFAFSTLRIRKFQNPCVFKYVLGHGHHQRFEMPIETASFYNGLFVFCRTAVSFSMNRAVFIQQDEKGCALAYFEHNEGLGKGGFNHGVMMLRC